MRFSLLHFCKYCNVFALLSVISLKKKKLIISIQFWYFYFFFKTKLMLLEVF